MPIEMHEKAHLDKACWCTGWKHWHYKKEAIDTLALHKTLEKRINEIEEGLILRSGHSGEWIKIDDVLQIIEEEFGRLTVDYIR